MSRLKTATGAVIGLALVGLVGFVAVVEVQLHRSYSFQQSTGPAGPAQVARGQYVAELADCAACHTAPNGAAFAGGYKLQTPFGPILSSNITSDPTTGIGNWTETQFNKAVRHGIGSHGYLYPAMPYNDYARMTDGDIDDLWAYVHTIPAVQNSVVENQLPFPYNQRWILFGWNLMFFHAGVFQPDPAKSDALNRGAYLVQAAGHCAACHTGKNALGGDSAAQLQGGTLAGWHAPDLTPNQRTGLGSWSSQDIVTYLQTGANAHAVAAGPMAEAVQNSTQYFTDADAAAVASYLQQLPASPAPTSQPIPASNAAMVTGKAVFEAECEACHTEAGQGVPNMVPALSNNPDVNADDPASLIHMVLAGGFAPKTLRNPTGAGMPKFDWRLPDDEIADVLTYIRNDWGNAAPAVDAKAVAAARQSLNAKAWAGH